MESWMYVCMYGLAYFQRAILSMDTTVAARIGYSKLVSKAIAVQCRYSKVVQFSFRTAAAPCHLLYEI